jgi:hypothetical protein
MWVPHFSRFLREVGFHEPHSLALLLRRLFVNNQRVPHFSRSLREVGFHEPHPLALLALDDPDNHSHF